MALSAGSNLGHYQILEPLGTGGMGEVYRARDTRLGRDVAIKVLPADHARDADRVARFQREAQVLASLNHPNVAAIHDIEKHRDTDFLILELVEGETLAERISRGAIPADEAVEIGKQIAEALSAAHEKGIVHRDLKPANVKLTPAGAVKVLDFGLAKFFEAGSADQSLSQSPTMMSVRTGGSVILGTAPYMSPEQARGRPVTKQGDVWALGCVLFEMLTQRPCFSGETVSDTIAKILKEEPDWRALEAVAPAPLRRIVARCLQKDPRRRIHDAADVRLELEEALAPAPSIVAPSRPRRTFALAALVLAALLLGFTGSAWYLRTAPQEPNWSGTLLSGPSIALFPRVSPDGTMLAFITLVDGRSQVAVMNPVSGNWTVLTHDKDPASINSLNWSADGTRIYYDRMQGGPRAVFSVPALGGEPRLILEDACSPVPLADGSIVVIRVNADRAGQLYRFEADGSELQPLNGVVQSIYSAPVRAFPDGSALVFYGKPANPPSPTAPFRLHILDLQTGEPRLIAPDLESDITISTGIGALGLGVNPIDRSVLVGVTVGDLYQVVSVPSDGKQPSRTLLTLTEDTWGIDMTANGSLFVDQVSRPVEIVRFGESDITPTSIAVLQKGMSSAIELPDRGILTTTIFNGRSRLSVVKPNKEIVPFVETEDETHEPLSFAGPNQVAFVLGNPPEESIGIASIKDGRLLKRLNVQASGGITSLAASNDGATLFYSSGSAIWSIPAVGGNATKLGAGDGVVYDPSRQDLVVYFFEQPVRLVRMPATGGPTEPLPLPEGARIETLVGPASIRSDGQIAFSVPGDSWFLGVGIFDPRSRTLRRVPLRYDADMFSLSWNQKNEIVTGAFLIRSSVWRFQLKNATSR